MTFTADQIGPVYDVGLATRDGSNVSCLDANGNPVPVSSIAYMCSVDRGKTMKEATELQEKSRLVQLGTSASIDREFDQWVQNTQGDWSAGLGQRVYGQQGVTNAYFDGEGLLWPLNDWIPQKSLAGPAQDVPTPAGSIGPAGPDSGTETIAPGGSATVKAMSCCFASFAPTGVAALVGVKGAFTQGTNVAVTPPYGQPPVAGNLLIAEVGGQRQNTTAPATLGETSAATSSFNFSGVNSDNEIGTNNTFVVPAGGITVSAIACYMGGHTAPVNTRFVIWNATTGAKIVSSATFAAGTGRSLKTKAITPVVIAAGTVIRIGFWRQQSQDAEWGVAASGTFRYHSNVGNENAQPNLVCVPAYVCGHIQAYITYTTGATSDITATAGWVKVAQRNSPDGFQQSQIWNKVAVGADAAPTFSAAQGASPMHAQVEEWSGMAAALPAVDQFSTATSSLLTSVTATNPATDVGAGDLVIMAVRSQLSIAATAGFTDVFNNGIAAVALGSSGASSLVNHSAFSYGIAPAGGAIAFASWAINGTAGGYVEGLGMGYAVAYLDSQGPPGHWHVTFFSGDRSFDVDLGVNTGGQQGPLHMHIAGGYLWVLFSNYPNASTLRVIMLGCDYGSNTFVQLRSDALPVIGGTSGFFGLIAASYVGGKLYVAVLQADQNIQPGAPAANRNALFIGDYSAGVGSVPTGLAAAVLVFPFTRGFKQVDLVWQGNTLVLAVGDGLDAYIYTVVSPFTAITTQAVIPGIANALLCAVGGTVFIVGWTAGPNGINRMDLYTLNGGQLTELPFTPIVPFLDSVTSPTTFGSYAFWAVSYPGAAVAYSGGGPSSPVYLANQKVITVYAYDVVRNRLFRALTFTDPSWTGSDVFGHDVIALYGVTQRTLAAGATFQSQLGLAIFSGQLSNNAESAREFYWGVTPITPAPTFSGLLQLGVDIVSGLFDFTAATNKLFRAALSHFIGGLVPGSSTPSVTLNAWFDQDPNRLNPAPDFTSNTGVPPNPLPSQLDLDLFTNRVARKLVYGVKSDGGGFDLGSNSWQNAPKITDVIVQAATGWVIDAVFDLAPGSKTNAGDGSPAYPNQTPAGAAANDSIDQVVAYNFLRQLWRLKGGECVLTLPNYDVYPALLQLLEFESPKPFAVSARSDQATQYQEFVTVKLREDI